MRLNVFNESRQSPTIRNCLTRQLVLHEGGFFFDQELDHLLFESLALMIIRIKAITKLNPPSSGLQKLSGLPLFQRGEFLHHGLPLGDEFLACLQNTRDYTPIIITM